MGNNFTSTDSTSAGDSVCFDFTDFNDVSIVRPFFSTVGSGCSYIVFSEVKGLFDKLDNNINSNNGRNSTSGGFCHEDIDNFFE